MAQGLLQLPTTGTVSGLQNNQDANAALAALATMVQGGSAPTPAATGLASTAGVLWHDTTNNQIKLRDQADATWMPCATVDEANKLVLLLLRSYLAGLALSNDGTTPNTKIDVAAGVCADDTNAAMISLPSGGAIDCATTGANGLDAGSLAAGTWYHAFAIAKPGGTSPALLASTSLSSPAFPSGYTLKRRVGSFKTDGSAHILAFKQLGDEFLWATQVQDVNLTNTFGATAQTLTLASVPPGLQVMARIRVRIGDVAATGAFAALISALDETDQVPSTAGPATTLVQTLNASGSVETLTRTNTSQQVRGRSSAAAQALTIHTYGWVDMRGRLN